MSRDAGSQAAYDFHCEQDVWVPMRDGIRLAVDVYRPARQGKPLSGPFPVLVERTPYNKRRPVLAEAGEYYARRGYVTVMQDVRGRYGSEGHWYFLSEVEGRDGFDTLAWTAEQPWCDGQVGTMGLSYSTATQQALAVLKPPTLKAQFLSDGGYNYFHRTLRHSGAFELGVLLPYAIRMCRESPDLARDPDAMRAFEAELDGLRPWLERLPLRERRSFLRHAPLEERWFVDMLTRSDYDEYWKQPTLNLAEHIDAYPDIPVFLQTSWYGHHVWATTEKYDALRRRHKSPKRLLIGHWLHGYDEYGRTFAGEVDFGHLARLDLNELRLRWFDHFLKGRETGILDGPPVRLYVMGGGSGGRNAEGRVEQGGSWRDEGEWPVARTQWTRFHLHAGGSLHRDPPPPGVAPLGYVFDPKDPVPTVGGDVQNTLFPGLIQGGAFDQRGRWELWACRDERPLAYRPDVLVFETPPLEADVEVTGPIEVRLWVSSSAIDTDFTAKLIDVHPPRPEWPNGFAMNLTDGILRARYRNGCEKAEFLTPSEIVSVTLELQATSNVFKAGHRIRLDISSSNFPRFDVNPNTGEPLGLNTRSQVAHNAVYVDADHASYVVLPIIPPSS